MQKDITTKNTEIRNAKFTKKSWCSLRYPLCSLWLKLRFDKSPICVLLMQCATPLKPNTCSTAWTTHKKIPKPRLQDFLYKVVVVLFFLSHHFFYQLYYSGYIWYGQSSKVRSVVHWSISTGNTPNRCI